MAMSQKRLDKMATMPQIGFHFDEETHLYLFDGKPLTGVTTILGVIAKPALIQWAADMVVTFLGWFDVRYVKEPEEVKEATKNLIAQIEFVKLNITSPAAWLAHLSMARTQHAKRKKQAGDVGKFAHAWIEKYVNAKIKGEKLPERDPAFGHMTDHFVQWAEENKVKFLAAEVKVYSRRYWYGGTFDLIVEIAGKIFIVDIKTGGGIYPEHFFQMGGYDIAVKEMQENEGLLINGQKIERTDGYIVLNLKKSGAFDKRVYFDLVLAKDAFLAALTLYRAIEKMTP
jgi:hypothetical protein